MSSGAQCRPDLSPFSAKPMEALREVCRLVSMVRYAEFQVLTAWVPKQDSDIQLATRPVGKTAQRWNPSYTVRKGFLYIRSRAISSRINDNYDGFPAEEIEKGYRTFVGKPVFVNHHNANHRRARGVIIDAFLHRDKNPDGSPDTWCEVLMEVDARRFPKLTQAILKRRIDRTSMGCNVAYSVCTYCGNKASTPADFCRHIPSMKGQRISRTTASGSKEAVVVAEMCYGLDFFENSLLVEPPADPTAYFVGMDTSGIEVTASQHQAVPTMTELPRTAPGEGYCTAQVNNGHGFCPCSEYASGRPVAGWASCARCGHTAQSHTGDTVVVGKRVQLRHFDTGKPMDLDIGVQHWQGHVVDDWFHPGPPDVCRRGPCKHKRWAEEYEHPLLHTASQKSRYTVKCDHMQGWHNVVDSHTGQNINFPNHAQAVRARKSMEEDHRSAEEQRKQGNQGDVVAPTPVDTLRDDNCPVCGENSTFKGNTCGVCGFMQPPSIFRDPDLTKARELDRGQGQNQDQVATPPPMATPPPVATPPGDRGQVQTPAGGMVATPPGSSSTMVATPPPAKTSASRPAVGSPRRELVGT